MKWLILLAGLIVALAAACTSASSTGTPAATDTPVSPGSETSVPGRPEGVLVGSVIIGPLCPVEPCSPGLDDPYESRGLQLQQEGADIILIPLQGDGVFRTTVPVGNYLVTMTDCDFLGCAGSFPVTVEIKDGEPTNLMIDIDTGIRSPFQPPSGYAGLADELRNAGADVEPGANLSQPFFSVAGQILTVNGQDVQVFEYPNGDDARAEAANISPDGSSIGTSMVMWIASPHFYSQGPLIVLYVGEDSNVQTLLGSVMGGQFAGRAPSGASAGPGHDPVTDEADSEARRKLSGRLGVPHEDLVSVHSQGVQFNNGALGCPDAGVAYTLAIVPGFTLLYEYQGIRYPYHVGTDGRFSTDCRHENNVAVPFRLADNVVEVKDAFQLAGGTPSNLGRETVLQTLAEAQDYLSQTGDLIDIDLSQVDWESEMLVGTVITGSGCSFEVWVPLVFMHHLEKTVDVSVQAVQSGLCEKAWAQPVWLAVQEVPKDYSASFILSYTSE